MSSAQTAARRIGQRVALAALGALLGLCVLEVALQIGALVLWATGRPAPSAWLTGRRRVLCLGDSNTYGLYLADRADAYPQQLERLWNASAARTPIEVLNLGYPGTNSSKLIHDLPRLLETFRPDVVLMMVGSNDFWTAPVPAAEAPTVPRRVVQLIERYSRVYQLSHMLGRAFDHRQLAIDYPVRVDGGASGTARYGDVEIGLGWRPGRTRGAETYVELEHNVQRLADIVQNYGAEPIFLTYASQAWNYGDASRAMRKAAAAGGLRLIDVAEPFAAQCPTEPCPEWLYKDHHPTARGYGIIAGELVRGLDGG